jgi:hypothetical protein
VAYYSGRRWSKADARFGYRKNIASSWWRQVHASDTKAAERRLIPPTMIQFGSSIGIGPVTVGTVVIQTAAAILVITLNTCIKMGIAEILVANST